MYRLPSTLLCVAAAVICLFVTALPCSAQTWDVAADFSPTQNPNGAWALGFTMTLGSDLHLYDLTGQPQPGFYTWDSGDNGWGGGARMNTSTNGINQWGWLEAGKFGYQPGLINQMATARWTSPVDGFVSVTARFTGQDPSGATTDVHVVKDGLVIFNGDIAGFIGTSAQNFADGSGTKRECKYSTVLSISTGDVIDFVTGYGGNGTTSDLTGLEATISTVTDPPATVSGQVTSDYDSSPIAEASVKTADGQHSAVTDENGNYSMNLSKGTYDIVFSKQGYASKTVSVTVEPLDAVIQNATLETGFISGTVLSSSDNSPVVGARIFTDDGQFYGVSGEDGTYSLQLPPGKYSIKAEAGGYATSAAVDVTINDAATDTKDFTMDLNAVFDAATDFSGYANPNGLWRYGYQLYIGGDFDFYDSPLHPRDGFTSWEVIGGDWAGAVRKNTSDAAYNQWGWFEPGQLGFQPGVSDEICDVRWTSPLDGYISINAEFVGQDPSGATTDVHVLKNNVSVFDGNINGFVGTKAADYADGFGINKLSHSCVVSVVKGDIIDFIAGYGSNNNTGCDATGVSATVTPLAGAPATISGKVTSCLPGNAAIAGAKVWIADTDYATTTDADGNYSITAPSGDIVLKASANSFADSAISVSAPAGDSVTQDITLNAGYLSGIVKTAMNNSPVKGAIVSTADGTCSAMTGEDGSYSMQVPAGDISVKASLGGYATFGPAAVTIPVADTATYNISLTPASIFDAAADFSPVVNPNGVWTYGYQLTMGGDFYLYEGVSSARDGFASWETAAPASGSGWAGKVAKNTSNTAYNQWGWYEAGELGFQPGVANEMCTVRWTSPLEGNILVSARYVGQDPSGTTTDVHVLKNGTSLYDGYVDGYIGTAAANYSDGSGSSREQKFVTLVPVSVGDTIDFTAGYGNGGTAFDATGVYATITSNPDLANVSKVKDIDGLEVGTLVQFDAPKVLAASPASFADKTGYVEEPDRTGGIKILCTSAVNGISAGDAVTLLGMVDTDANGEKILKVISMTRSDQNIELKPLGMNNKAAASSRALPTKLLVTVWGKVSFVDSNLQFMYVDDGSGVNDGNANGAAGIKVILSGTNDSGLPSAAKLGDSVSVVGIFDEVKNGDSSIPVVKPRSAVDITDVKADRIVAKPADLGVAFDPTANLWETDVNSQSEVAPTITSTGLNFVESSSQGWNQVHFQGQDGLALSDIKALKYSEFVTNMPVGQSNMTLSAKLFIDVNDDGQADFFLICEPYLQGSGGVAGTWQVWDVLNSGRWWCKSSDWQSTPVERDQAKPLSDYIAQYPTAKLCTDYSGAIVIFASDLDAQSAGFTATLGSLTIGTNDWTKVYSFAL